MIFGQILIVDDNETVRRSLRSLISTRPGWMICGEAVDGLDAIEKAKAMRPDVVLMDISMPRMNGLEATRILRKELPEVKVVIVSQNDPAIVQHQAREVDAAAHVAKNHIARDLFSTLDRIVGKDSATNSLPEPTSHGSETIWLAGGGALGCLIREHDWSQTSLGPIPVSYTHLTLPTKA